MMMKEKLTSLAYWAWRFAPANTYRYQLIYRIFYQNMWNSNILSHAIHQNIQVYQPQRQNNKNKNSPTLQIMVIFEILEYSEDNPGHTTKISRNIKKEHKKSKNIKMNKKIEKKYICIDKKIAQHQGQRYVKKQTKQTW